MEIINGNKIIEYIYDTGYDKIEGNSINEATRKFEEWINNNTPYRGLSMYAKHKGYHLIYKDEHGNKYICNGNKTYKVDDYGCIITE